MSGKNVIKFEGLQSDFDSFDATPLVPEYENLVRNPSFEVDTSYWGLATVPEGNGSFSQSTEGARVGAHSAKLVCMDVEEVAFSVVGATGDLDGINVEPGHVYSARAALVGTYMPTAVARLVLYFYNDQGEGLASFQGPGASGSAALSLTLSGVRAPAGAVHAALQVLILGEEGDVSCYVDAVVLHEGSTPRAYFDGDSPGATWNGPPHKSTSRTGGQVATEAEWRYSGHVSMQNEALTLGPDSELRSAVPYDLRASAVFARVDASDGFSMAVLGTSGNSHALTRIGDELVVSRIYGGNAQPSTVIGSYDPESTDEIRHWRISAVDNEVSFSVSTDGVFWEERAVFPAGFDISAVTLIFANTGSGAGSAYSLNIPENQFGDRIYRDLPGKYKDHEEEFGFSLLKFLRAIGESFAVQYQLTYGNESGDVWSLALDVDDTPDYAIGWLATLAGVRLPEGTPTKFARALIKDRPNRRRGTVRGITDAVQKTLTGTKRVDIIERDGSAYRLTVKTYDAETPDPVATYKALLSQKPAGIVLDYQVIGGRTWDEATKTWDTAGTVTWNSSAYAAV